MSNDVDLTWIMASGKAASDRAAALGFQGAPHHRGGGDSFRNDVESSPGGGGGLLLAILVGFGWVMWKIAEIVIPILLRLGWEALKLLGLLVGTALSSGRR